MVVKSFGSKAKAAVQTGEQAYVSGTGGSGVC
jgi:hypothetical protein